jgi:hypothetical protein
VQEEILSRMQAHPACAQRYDLVRLCELRGELDTDILAAALNDVAARHSALRTLIDAVNGTPVQRVEMRSPLLRERDDVSSAAEFADALLDERYGLEQVLGGKALFRPQVARLGSDHHLLGIAIHHLHFDSVSQVILWRDLSACYRARLRGEAPALPELGATYLEFSRSQRDEWSASYDDTLAYWSKVVADAPRSIAWPHPDEPAPHYACEVRSFALSASDVEQVRRIALGARVSPFLVLLAATGMALGRVIGQDDLMLGTDFANREAAFKTNMIGAFINTRLTRLRLAGTSPFSRILHDVREMWLDSDEYNAVHLYPVLQRLGIPSLASVHLDQEDFAVNPDFPGVTVTSVPTTRLDPYWRDFLLNWRFSGNLDGGDLYYRPSCVDPAAAKAAVEQILHILRSTCE